MKHQNTGLPAILGLGGCRFVIESCDTFDSQSNVFFDGQVDVQMLISWLHIGPGLMHWDAFCMFDKDVLCKKCKKLWFL